MLVELSVVVYEDDTLPLGVYPAFPVGVTEVDAETAILDAVAVPETLTEPCVPENVGFDTVPFGLIVTVPLSTYAN